MKSDKILSILMILAVCCTIFSIVGCMKPPKIEVVEEIDTNETAFLVPLEGNTKGEQAKFMSVDYLESSKVAAKRVTIPQREIKIGRFGWQIKWIPTMRLIKVNRSPVTREWTIEHTTGTSSKNEEIYVESKDSIGFSVGVNITTMIHEEDASKFLYYYAGNSLGKVTDINIRGKVAAILTREFQKRDLVLCKSEKSEIVQILELSVIDEFKKYGITVSSIGLVGGLTYEDIAIQTAINDAYVAEMMKTQRENEAESLRIFKKGEADAQKFENEKNLSIAVTQKQEAQEFAKVMDAMIKKVELEIEMKKAEALLQAAMKWNGSTPSNILPQNSSMLFGLDRQQ